MSNGIFSYEAEIGLLSIVINNPECVVELNDVKPFMFSAISSQELFKVIWDMHLAGNKPDFELLKTFVNSTGKTNKIGGEEYLRHLKSLPHSLENLGKYKRLVINSYKSRSLLSLTSGLKIENPDDVDSILSSFKSRLDDISVSSGGEKTVLLGHFAKEGWEEVISRLNRPGIRGFDTGYEILNASTGGFSPGDVWLIASRPSHGKTAFVCNSSLTLGNNGVPNLIFSYEMNQQELFDRLLAVASGVSLIDIRLGTFEHPDDYTEILREAKEKIKDYPIHIDTNFSGDLSYITNTIRKYNSLHGVQVFFVDYIQLMAERDADSTHALGRISRQLKLLANELQICVVIVSQINRLVEGRDDKRPQMADVRQSGNLEEDANIVMVLYREDVYTPVEEKVQKVNMEVIIRKNRNGPIGVNRLQFERHTNRILEA